MSNKLTTKEFITRARKVHGDKYNYSLVDYINSNTKVEIICPVHGGFLQQPSGHLTGRGCLACKKEAMKDTKETFILKARKVHGDRYDYSNVVYNRSKDYVSITCLVHNKDFLQKPSNHLKEGGQGCPLCGRDKTKGTTAGFIKKSKALWGEKFSYDKAEYKSYSGRVTVICDIHGEVHPTVEKHLSSKTGCPVCNKDVQKDSMTRGKDEFITLANKLHKDRYDYTASVYLGCKIPVEVVCSREGHGSFYCTPDNHLSKLSGCPRCGNNISKAEARISTLLEDLGVEVTKGNRKLIKPYELDLVIPAKRIAIEYNGVRWHTEKFGKDKHYHKNKTDMCNQAGYRLIHIWEDDYLANPEKELKFLAHALGVSDTKPVYARKTVLKEIEGVVAKPFLDEHHIQGAVSSSVYLGHFYEDELVAVTTFTFKNKKSYAELTRHTTKGGVLGSLGKATKWFSKTYKINIISFCDLSRFDGKSYVAAGFEKIGVIAPDYKYVAGNKREHKFGWRKKSIQTKLPEIYDESLTEKQMMDLADIPRVWDCGKIKFEYKYKGESK